MSVQRLVLHFHCDRPSHFLHLRCHIIIVPWGLVNEAVRPVDNNPLILFLQLYWNFEGGLVVASTLRRRSGVAVMAASTDAPAPPLLTAGIIMEVIGLMHKRCSAVSLCASYIVIRYVRWQAWRTCTVNNFCRNSVFCLNFLLHNCLG